LPLDEREDAESTAEAQTGTGCSSHVASPRWAATALATERTLVNLGSGANTRSLGWRGDLPVWQRDSVVPAGRREKHRMGDGTGGSAVADRNAGLACVAILPGRRPHIRWPISAPVRSFGLAGGRGLAHAACDHESVGAR
jgi:hypothetical protein